MGYNDSYKGFEKLCGELLNDDRRISAYIDEMISIPNCEDYVICRNDDLKDLKQYRRMRNQTDPLAAYAKVVKPTAEQKPPACGRTRFNHVRTPGKRLEQREFVILCFKAAFLIILFSAIFVFIVENTQFFS